MARDDDTFVYIGAYADEQAAGLDYEAVKELHAAHVIGSYDAAVIRKDTDGTVHVNKDETSTRAGAWGGLAVGALVGILFPPSIIGTAAIGALAGGVGGHLWKGMSRGDMKDLGEALDSGQSALVVIGDWRLQEAVDRAFSHAERHIARELKGLDRADMERDIAAMMAGQ